MIGRIMSSASAHICTICRQTGFNSIGGGGGGGVGIHKYSSLRLLTGTQLKLKIRSHGCFIKFWHENIPNSIWMVNMKYSLCLDRIRFDSTYVVVSEESVCLTDIKRSSSIHFLLYSTNLSNVTLLYSLYIKVNFKILVSQAMLALVVCNMYRDIDLGKVMLSSDVKQNYIARLLKLYINIQPKKNSLGGPLSFSKHPNSHTNAHKPTLCRVFRSLNVLGWVIVPW